MESDENTLRAAAVFFLNHTYINKSLSTIKIKLRNAAELSSQAKNDPTNLILKLKAFFESKNNNEKLTATLALNEGVVVMESGKKFLWGDSKEPIFIAAQSKDAIQEFSAWLKNDESGRQSLSAIASKIEELS